MTNRELAHHYKRLLRLREPICKDLDKIEEAAKHLSDLKNDDVERVHRSFQRYFEIIAGLAEQIQSSSISTDTSSNPPMVDQLNGIGTHFK